MAAPFDDPLAVTASQLTVGYRGRVVVEGIDLVLASGRSLALVGINGSGKSTLLRTIAGLLAPLGGELRVFGHPPRSRARRADHQHRVAYLGQFHPAAGLLPLPVRDVVMMGRYPRRGLLGRLGSEDRRCVSDALDSVELADVAEAPLRSLSGGQQQRVYLAQALARQADLLLLDEPTAGLDAHSIGLYAQLMAKEQHRGAAVITATHDVSDAARADTVLLLAGAVVAYGAPHEVLTPQQLARVFGNTLLAVPHGDHTDLVHPEHPHGHDQPHQPPHPHHPGRQRRSG
ncbi:MAG: metal ABC transporter ATP-binding protein [Acidimicrobiales bacterium]